MAPGGGVLIELALLALSVGVKPDCDRFRFDYRAQPCELKREKGEVLRAAGRPPIRKLGGDAFRFSTSPTRGNRSAIVEIVPRREGGATVRSFSLEGHLGFGWTFTGSASFVLPADEHRRFLSEIEAAMPPYRYSDGESREPAMILCTDGPGYLIERLQGGTVETLAGFCSLDSDMPHPNIVAACRLDELFRRYLKKARRPDLSIGDRCERLKKGEA